MILDKLILLIAQSYLTRATGGPAARLKSLLLEIEKTGWTDPPGSLPNNFWSTKDEFTGQIVGD
jgi:hypothetical protein